MNTDIQNNIVEYSLQINIPDFVRFILDRLNKNGFKAYIVGGAIRDALLERKVLDWDITTEAKACEIQSVFKGIKQFALKHQTVTLIDSGMQFEVTTMKRDDGETPYIFGDLRHRDFTLNAMAYDSKKSIVIDPHGGIVDIERKTIKTVNNPDDRFKEDPLRMLRAIRIAGELDFKIDKGTIDSIFSLSSILNSVSVERIRDELIRIILCNNPSNLLEILQKTGLMEVILPELLEGYEMKQNSWHSFTVFKHATETVNNISSNSILRLAALFHDIGKPRVKKEINGEFHFHNHESISSSIANDIMERLKFSREEIKKVTALISLHMIYYTKAWTDAAVRRLIRRAGRDNIDDLIMLRKADIIAHGKIEKKLDLICHLEQRILKMKNEDIAIDLNDLAIDGKKVMKIMEICPGPEVGKILRKLLDLIIDDPELNSEDSLIEILKGFRKDIEV